jgi:fucose 4-O-acetylase-like acetyltransferase
MHIIEQAAGSRQPLAIDNELSKRIKSLRFLLIIFVVFIHNQISEIKFSDGNQIYEIPIYIEKIRYLISEIISRIAVPLFFLISGYLLYKKEIRFTTNIKKKYKTILIPYFFWNIVNLSVFIIGQNLPFTKAYFGNPINDVSKFGLLDWLDVFGGKFTGRSSPINVPLWFLRDLFILNLLSIGIKKIIDNFPLGIIVLFFMLWIGSLNIYIVSNEALLFFSLGYYIIKYDLNYKHLDNINNKDISIIYLITILLELFLYNSIPIIHKINIIIGILFLIKHSKFFIENKKLYESLIWLEGYAFIVYAFHGIILGILQKIYVRIFPMYGWYILLEYFGVAIFGIIICILTGLILKKLTPKIYSIIIGGRI